LSATERLTLGERAAVDAAMPVCSVEGRAGFLRGVEAMGRVVAMSGCSRGGEPFAKPKDRSTVHYAPEAQDRH
jgi:hypothetical protein